MARKRSRGLDKLIERYLDWIKHRVRQRLGDRLRQKVETHDIVQEAMIDVMRYGPKVVMNDLHQFRSLMARISTLPASPILRREERYDRARAYGAKLRV